MKLALLFVVLMAISNQVFAEYLGGISGGGGGTIIQTPVGRYEIEAILTGARFPVFMYFNSFRGEADLKNISHPQGGTVSDLLKKVRIQINSAGPCVDANGTDVDGSIYSPVPNTICISSKNLGEKLTQDNAFTQTIALVTHEYTHLLGATESEAKMIQDSVLSQINSNLEYRTRYGSLTSEFVDKWLNFVQRIPQTADIRGDRTVFLKKITSFVNQDAFVDAQEKYYAEMYWRYYPLLTREQKQKIEVLLAKWKVIRIGIEHHYWGNSDETQNYELGFGGKKEVRLKDFEKVQKFPLGDGLKPLPPSDVTVRRIDSDQDVIDSWNQLRAEFSAIYHEAIEIHFELMK